MNTTIDTIYSDYTNDKTLSKYADIINSGGLVAFPTETVYGLGADALNENAVLKIFKVKNRPANNPLIAHISSLDMLDRIAKNIPQEFYRLFHTFWPGALTVVLDKKNCVPHSVCAGGDTVAVRFPSHPIASKLIELADTPIVAPSANLSGKPSPTRFEHVFEDLNTKVDGIIDGGDCDIGIESTVISYIGTNALKILRPGAITKEMLEDKGFSVEIDEHVLIPAQSTDKVASPGMLYKHYAPNAKMELVRGTDSDVISYIQNKIKNSEYRCGVLCFDGETKFFKNAFCYEYGIKDFPLTLSKNLFSALREFNNTNVEYIYARVIEPKGVGLGIYNRMLRAASFNVTALKNGEII